MSTLSVPQVLALARNAGFNAAQSIIVTAISIAESGLRTDAIGPVGEIGLTQVYPVAHPQYTRACLLDPQCNMNAAFQISSSGTNWHAWTTYNTGAYKQFLPQVQSASSGLPGTIDPCLSCGILGSAAYIKCHAALAAKVGNVPDCAKAAIAQNQKDLQSGVSSVVDCLSNPAQCLQDAILGPIEQFLPQALEKIGLMLFALVLVVVGFVVLGGPAN